MKRITSILLVSLIICTSAACSSQKSGSESKISSSTEVSQTSFAAPETANEPVSSQNGLSVKNAPELPQSIQETIDDYDFEGVIYAVKKGENVIAYAEGTLENGDEIDINTPMPIGSVSKQFCAAAVLVLQEQGKLSADDTLDKYFPEYEEGKKISLHNMLSMQSGIPEMLSEDIEDIVSIDKKEEENKAAIKKWLFDQPLDFEPGKQFEYVNSNYFLLSDIVEQVSGKKYIDFLRENFLKPLGMEHTGTIGELPDSPEWANGTTYKELDAQPGLTNGCGDLISNVEDMNIWINALSSGNAISAESYKAMTTDYSQSQYGYGMFLEIQGGVGHPGSIGIYSSFDYLNKDEDLTLLTLSNTIYPPDISMFADDLITDLTE